MLSPYLNYIEFYIFVNLVQTLFTPMPVPRGGRVHDPIAGISGNPAPAPKTKTKQPKKPKKAAA